MWYFSLQINLHKIHTFTVSVLPSRTCLSLGGTCISLYSDILSSPFSQLVSALSSHRFAVFLIKFILRYFIVWASHCPWDTFLITFLNGCCWVYRRGVNVDAILSPAMLMNSLFRLIFFLWIRSTLNAPCLSHWGWAFLKSKRLRVPGWQQLNALTL